jgi:hypothetical protein
MIRYLLIATAVFSWACTPKAGEGAFTAWIDHLLTDSTHIRSGSLLAEPFSQRNNQLPDIIYLSQHQLYSGPRDQIVKLVFAIKDSLRVIPLPEEELKQLVQTNKISQDTAIFHQKNRNVLGRVYINQVFTSTNRNTVYIDHAYSGPQGKSIFAAVTALKFSNGKWTVTRTEVYEMSN